MKEGGMDADEARRFWEVQEQRGRYIAETCRTGSKWRGLLVQLDENLIAIIPSFAVPHTPPLPPILHLPSHPPPRL
ncbi:hypothetical protein MRB53_037630 [Persea americana]|nr:hypothetical protein MRB53_037630 [Persea americana]